MPTPRQVQSIATVNTCVNNRIYAFFQHKKCGCKCKGDCVHKQMFYFLIMDALNSPYIDSLTQEQINCMIAHAECGSKFPPKPTNNTCLACDYSINFSLADSVCDYTFTFNAKITSIYSYTKNGATVIVDVVVTNLTLLAYLQSLDAGFGGYTTSGSGIIFTLTSGDVYSFDTFYGSVTEEIVPAVAVTCATGFPLWIYEINGNTVNEEIANYTELQDYMLTLGFSPNIPQTVTQCDYLYSFTGLFDGVFGYDIEIIVNGVPSGTTTINSQGDLDLFFAGYGFTKLGNTSYEITSSVDVYGDITFNLAGGFSCTMAAQSMIDFELAIYLDTTILPELPFTGISLDLDGTVYTDGAVYSTVQQMLEWMNSLVTGQGYFYYDTLANEIVARVASYTVPVFGDLIIATAGTPVTVVVSTSATSYTTWKFGCSGVSYPTTSLSIDIDGITYNTVTPMANIAAVSAWINSLVQLTLGYASVSGTDIYIGHRKTAISAFVTFPTTLFEIVVDAVTYTAPGVINDAYEAVQYMNTLGFGEFSTDGTIVYFIPYDNQIWLNTTDDGGTWFNSTSGYTGALQIVLNLSACIGAAGGTEVYSPYVSDCIHDYWFTKPQTCTQYYSMAVGDVDITALPFNDAYTMYDMSSMNFPDGFYIDINGVNSDGIYATDINDLVTKLNLLGAGTFVDVGSTIIVTGAFVYGKIFSYNVVFNAIPTTDLPNYVTNDITFTLVNATQWGLDSDNPALDVADLSAAYTALGVSSDVVDNGATMDITLYRSGTAESFRDMAIGKYEWDLTTITNYPNTISYVTMDGVITQFGQANNEAIFAANMEAALSGDDRSYFYYDSTLHTIVMTSTKVFVNLRSTQVFGMFANTTTATQTYSPTAFSPGGDAREVEPASFAPTTILFQQSNCSEIVND